MSHKRLRRLILGTSAWALACWLASSIHAAESPLAQIPGEPVLVLQIRGLERTRERLTRLAKELDGELEGSSRELANFLVGLIPLASRLEGLDPDRFTALVVRTLPTEAAKPIEWSLLARVQDREKLVKSLEARGDSPKGLMSISGAYALVTRDASFAADLAGSKALFDSLLEPELASALLTHDVAVFVNTRKLRSENAGQLDGFFAKAQSFTGDFKRFLRKKRSPSAEAPTPQEPLPDGFPRKLLAEARGIVVACDLREGGVLLHLETVWEKEQPAEPPSPLPGLLRKLPAGCGAYGYFSGEAKRDSKGEQRRARAIAISESALLRLELASDPARITEEKEAKLEPKATESRPKDKSVRGVDLDLVVQKPEVYKRELELFENAFLEGPDAADVPGMLKHVFFSWLEEPTFTWSGHAEGELLSVTAKKWEDAQGLIESVLDRRFLAWQDPAWTDAVRQLPSEATGFVVVSVPLLTHLLTDVIPPRFPSALQPKLIHSSYAGFALTKVARRTSLDAWVPTSAMRMVRDFAKARMQNRGIQQRSR